MVDAPDRRPPWLRFCQAARTTCSSFGRDHGMFGRILNQTVIVTQSLAMRGDKEIVGTCFTPQDGNSLLSSIAATLWFMYPESYEEKLAPVRPYFFSEI